MPQAAIHYSNAKSVSHWIAARVSMEKRIQVLKDAEDLHQLSYKLNNSKTVSCTWDPKG